MRVGECCLSDLGLTRVRAANYLSSQKERVLQEITEETEVRNWTSPLFMFPLARIPISFVCALQNEPMNTIGEF